MYYYKITFKKNIYIFLNNRCMKFPFLQTKKNKNRKQKATIQTYNPPLEDFNNIEMEYKHRI